MNFLEQLLAEEEGRKATVYPDPLGFLTIGIGCLVDPKVKGAGLCDAAIDAQFAHDTQAAAHLATLFPRWAEHSPLRQAVLTSMTFQMGAKPLGWKQFTAALAQLNYSAAADAGLDSDWARTETPHRAEREMQMLRSDEWVEKP